MKTHIKTKKQNYILNFIICGIIAFYVGFWRMFSVSHKWDWFFIVPTILIFHHFFRAGEYLLTGRVINISARLIDGYEEKGKRAKWSFIYYLTTATLLSIWIIYLSSNLSKSF